MSRDRGLNWLQVPAARATERAHATLDALPDRTTTSFALTPITEVSLVDLDLMLQWTVSLNGRRWHGTMAWKSLSSGPTWIASGGVKWTPS